MYMYVFAQSPAHAIVILTSKQYQTDMQAITHAHLHMYICVRKYVNYNYLYVLVCQTILLRICCLMELFRWRIINQCATDGQLSD